jgi:hypothetical protein
MSAIATAIIGGAVITGVASNAASKRSSEAAQDATAAQTSAADQGLALQREQMGIQQHQMDLQQENFNRVQGLLDPYVQAGSRGLNEQFHLLGLGTAEEQRKAISGIENSPYFSGLVKQGENAILQNASATGGLRGGNTQAALAQFRPNMLAAAIDQQYQRLGGLVNIGQNASAGVGNSGQAMANGSAGVANAMGNNASNQAGLLGQLGAAQAGGALAQGRADAQAINGISSAFGTGLSGLAMYANQPSSGGGITGTGGGNAGPYSTGTTLNNNFGGQPSYFS